MQHVSSFRENSLSTSILPHYILNHRTNAPVSRTGRLRFAVVLVQQLEVTVDLRASARVHAEGAEKEKGCEKFVLILSIVSIVLNTFSRIYI